MSKPSDETNSPVIESCSYNPPAPRRHTKSRSDRIPEGTKTALRIQFESNQHPTPEELTNLEVEHKIPVSTIKNFYSKLRTESKEHEALANVKNQQLVSTVKSK